MTTRRIVTALFLTLIIATGFVAGRATADQPNMQAALDHLREARESLDKASADKGGHRARAIQLVNDAIAQVEAGIAYERRH
jgi:hypothetical protein